MTKNFHITSADLQNWTNSLIKEVSFLFNQIVVVVVKAFAYIDKIKAI